MDSSSGISDEPNVSSIHLHLNGTAPKLTFNEHAGWSWVDIGPLCIFGTRTQLGDLARSILTQLADLESDAVEATSTTVEVGELVRGDTITVPDWPGERWEPVVLVDEMAPGFYDVHAASGERFTWPADHAVKVRLPRPGSVPSRQHAVPCRGLHDMADRPDVVAEDGLCSDCRDSKRQAAVIFTERADEVPSRDRHPSGHPVPAGGAR
jgi:hypothetical protein